MLTLLNNLTFSKRSFRLARPGVAALGHDLERAAQAVGRFARKHAEDQIYEGRTFELAPLMRAGRLVVMVEDPPPGRRAPSFAKSLGKSLAGVAICTESEDVPDLYEIAMTVVRKDCRRLGLGGAMVRALAVQECAENTEIEGIVSVTREDNHVCCAATRALGATPRGPKEIADDLPRLEPFAESVTARMRANGRTQAPTISVLAPRTLREGGAMMLAARTPKGFALKDSVRLRLGEGWDAKDLWPEIAAIAEGWRPRAPLWDPSGGRLSA